MYVKIHKSEGSVVVAVCDEDLIGKELSSGELFLKVSESFYKGELKDKKGIKEILKDARNVNLVGKECVEIAKEIGLVENEHILMFGDIPYAQCLVL